MGAATKVKVRLGRYGFHLDGEIHFGSHYRMRVGTDDRNSSTQLLIWMEIGPMIAVRKW
jgi:hypothetical protein